MKPNSRAKAALGPRVRVRTSNDAEILVCAALERDGWELMKRGWPDFIAVRGNEVRFVEVKPDRTPRLKREQQRVAEILEGVSGIKVELLTPASVIAKVTGSAV